MCTAMELIMADPSHDWDWKAISKMLGFNLIAAKIEAEVEVKAAKAKITAPINDNKDANNASDGESDRAIKEVLTPSKCVVCGIIREKKCAAGHYYCDKCISWPNCSKCGWIYCIYCPEHNTWNSGSRMFDCMCAIT